MMMRVAVLAICVATGIAAADSESASQLFDEGRVLLEQGDKTQACERFHKSYELERAPGTALNLAVCEEDAAHWSAAFDLYNAAAKTFEESDQPARAKFASDRASAVQRSHPEVVATLQPTTTPEPARPEAPPRRIAPKIVAGSAFAIAAVSFGLFLHYHMQMQDFEEADLGNMTARDRNGLLVNAVGNEQCGEVTFEDPAAQTKFRTACTAARRGGIAAKVGLVSAAVGAGTLIYLVVTKPHARRHVDVVPAVTNDGASVFANWSW